MTCTEVMSLLNTSECLVTLRECLECENVHKGYLFLYYLQAISRLGGQQLTQECKFLKVKILDQTNLEIMQQIIETQEELKELRQTLDNFNTEHSDVIENLKKLQDPKSTLHTEYAEDIDRSKDPIPRNIRGIR